MRRCEADPVRHGFHVRWRNAKIVREPTTTALADKPLYQVEFPDGTRGVFDAERIRPISDREVIAQASE